MSNVVKWLANGERGASSMALAVATLGELPKDGHCYPHDGDDLRRCIQLYEQAPETVDGLARLAAFSGPWKRISEHWSELLESHYSGDYAATTKLLRKVVDPEERSVRYFRKGADGRWDFSSS